MKGGKSGSNQNKTHLAFIQCAVYKNVDASKGKKKKEEEKVPNYVGGLFKLKEKYVDSFRQPAFQGLIESWFIVYHLYTLNIDIGGILPLLRLNLLHLGNLFSLSKGGGLDAFGQARIHPNRSKQCWLHRASLSRSCPVQVWEIEFYHGTNADRFYLSRFFHIIFCRC